MPTFTQPVEPLGGLTGPHLLENFISAEFAPEVANALWYHPGARVWIGGGRSGSPVKAIAFYTTGGSTIPRWRQRSADSGIDSEFVCKCFDKKATQYLGENGIRMSGVFNTGSTSNKVYYSSDLGINWTALSIGSSNTTPADNIDYDPTIGSLVTIGSNVYRAATYNGIHSISFSTVSPIPRRGLTIRSAYGGRSAMAAIVDNSFLARYTTNGTSWSTSSLPATFSIIEWSEHRKTFVGLSTSGAIYENPDLATGSWTLTSVGPYLTVGLFGPYLIACQNDSGVSGMRRFIYSLDGTTWVPMIYTFPNSGALTFNEITAAYRPGATYPHQLGIAMTGVNNPMTHILSAAG